MTTNTKRFDFFPEGLMEGIEMLSDPAQTVRRDIVKGEVSGKIDLQHAVFPPKGIHRNNVPFTVRFEMEGWVTFELHLMAILYGDIMSGTYSFMGIITHDQHQELRKQAVFPFEYTSQFVGIHFNTNLRRGNIFIPKDTYHVLEILESENLLRVRSAAIEKLEPRLLLRHEERRRG